MKLRELIEAKGTTFADVVSDMTGKTVNDAINVSGDITSLKGAPKIVKDNFFVMNAKLTSLEYAPEKVYGQFSCAGNQITSLHNVHKHIKEIHGEFFASSNPLKSHILGLLLISGITDVLLIRRPTADNKILTQVEEIINKYLPNHRGNDAVLDCQNELIDVGLEEYAQL